ncbi:DUF6385 domain-containing protein [Caloramator proteoclasticus]|uniref:DUF6385 domain-containing protein n=1 Tax=Caloramator proteoclasticus DSM 10124 TaxID=1121262 RepID=A0A1M4UCJ1_9CLOT|nr:DUF6385 domain-containing protein [Caloramator proteoclasticus]SHE54376.1 hypothetical protein SAMN02746091_00614 [Caloramator proteoclasticus DSM 10124]
MPNNAVFSNSASDLKVQIFGSSVTTPIQVDSNGKLQILTENPINVTATDLDIRNLSSSQDGVAVYGSNDGGTTMKILKTNTDGELFITSDETLTVQATDLDIRNLTTDDSVSIYGTDGTDKRQIKTDSSGRIEVASIANEVDIRNLSNSQDSILIYGYDGENNKVITTDSDGLIKVVNAKRSFESQLFGDLNTTDSFTYLSFKDVSMYSDYVFYIKNKGSNSASLIVQISPTNNANDAIDHIIDIIVTSGAKELIIPSKFLQYVRLGYKSTLSGQSTTLDVYFQARY